MTASRESYALIINTASYERVAFALSIANAEAALGNRVAVLFGYGGLMRLRRGYVDEVGEETEPWMRDQVALELQKGRFPRISELLETLPKLGGRICACPAAMALHNLTRDELIEGVTRVCGVVSFLTEEAEDASTVLYV